LQDSVAWIALGVSSSPFGVLAFPCALPALRRCRRGAALDYPRRVEAGLVSAAG
jgi:hypothetical protein